MKHLSTVAAALVGFATGVSAPTPEPTGEYDTIVRQMDAARTKLLRQNVGNYTLDRNTYETEFKLPDGGSLRILMEPAEPAWQTGPVMMIKREYP